MYFGVILTQGPVVPMFEEAIAKSVKAKHGVAMNSATSALHSTASPGSGTR